MIQEKDSEVIAINYWKEVKKELSRILISYWNTLLIIHHSMDFVDLVEFINRLPYKGKIAYISLTKTYDSLTPHFDKIDAKFYTVDCVSSVLFEMKDTEDCTFVYPPANLVEMAEMIEKYLDETNPDFIIIDSLSIFSNYSSLTKSDNIKFQNFFKYLENKRGNTPCKFILLYDESVSSTLGQFPSYHIDIILKLEVIKGRIFWS